MSREPAQELDAPDPEPAAGPAPHAFISPSVKEYLELGVAIPGKFHAIMPACIFKFITLDASNGSMIIVNIKPFLLVFTIFCPRITAKKYLPLVVIQVTNYRWIYQIAIRSVDVIE